jgi:hypothetical protein
MVIDVDAEEHAGAVVPRFSKFRMATDAAKMAMEVYTLGQVFGWNLTDGFADGNDHVGLYQAGSTCVVAFAGSNDPKDWMDNFDIRTINKCGLDLHLGFYNSLLASLQKYQWQRLAKVLSGSTCKHIVATGHSQGGAMASILATCANQYGGLDASLPKFPAFTVDELYTIGAPGISKQPVNDDRTPNGCFSGMRVVNWDWGSYDPVPFVTHAVGFLHPRIELTRLILETSWWGGRTLTKESYPCTSSEALTYPSVKHWWHIPHINMHMDYVQRLQELFR